MKPKPTIQQKFEKRRLCEDNLYEIIDTGLILRRLPLKKQKKVKERVRLSTADYTFLQFHHLIWQWVLRNNKYTEREINTLLYLYPLGIFTREQAVQCIKELGFSTTAVWKGLKEKGTLTVWSKRGRVDYYILSTSASTLIQRMHRMFMLEEEIPMSSRRNVIAASKSRKDKKLMDLFKMFNNKVKKG